MMQAKITNSSTNGDSGSDRDIDIDDTKETPWTGPENDDYTSIKFNFIPPTNFNQQGIDMIKYQYVVINGIHFEIEQNSIKTFDDGNNWSANIRKY